MQSILRAHQWYANGDHPEDNSEIIVSGGDPFLTEGNVVRRFLHPYIKGDHTCTHCNKLMKLHGWIDQGDKGITVCPSNWIFKLQGLYQVIRNDTYLLLKSDLIAENKVISDLDINMADQFDFGTALTLVKLGDKLQRKGWNGSGMYIYYVPAASYPAQRNSKSTMAGVFADDMVPYREYLALKTAQNDVSTWAPSVSDALAEDWQVVV